MFEHVLDLSFHREDEQNNEVDKEDLQAMCVCARMLCV